MQAFPLPSHASNELNQESELITTELSLQTLTLEWLAGASRTHSDSVHPSSDSVGLDWGLRIFQLVQRLPLHMWKTQPLCERTAWLESVTLCGSFLSQMCKSSTPRNSENCSYTIWKCRHYYSSVCHCSSLRAGLCLCVYILLYMNRSQSETSPLFALML